MSERVTIEFLKDERFVEDIGKLGAMFHAQASRPGRFNVNHAISVIDGLLTTGHGAMFVERGLDGSVIGTICGVISPDIFTGDIIASELFWFVDPWGRGSAGPRLYKAFMDWSSSLGARHVLMAHMHFAVSEKAARFYERHGFKMLETIYVRDS